MTTLYGTTANDTLEGTSLDDAILGLSGDDLLEGQEGGDLLDGGPGTDTLVGASGDDRFYVDNTADLVREQPYEGSDTVFASVSFKLPGTGNLGFVEGLVLVEGAGDIDGRANSLDNLLRGNGGANKLEGLAGDDVISGLGGDDSALGGGGSDSLDGGLGDDLLAGETANDHLSGASGEDSLYGDVGYDLLYGGSGGDALFGGEGEDLLDGQGGGDRAHGGPGDDTFLVDRKSDIVEELDGEGRDTVFASADFRLPNDATSGFVEELRLAPGTEDIDGKGNALGNLLRGNAGSNKLDGLGGSDTLLGFLGDDSAYGGPGGDTIKGADGDDHLAGLAGHDGLWGASGADLLEGGVGADSLYGNRDDDKLYGGSGGDLLQGGDGNDRLSGGSGADSFAFLGEAVGHQGRVLDFTGTLEGGGDKLLIEIYGGDGAWIGEGDFEGSSGPEVRFKDLGNGNGQIVIDADGDGRGDSSAKLVGISKADLLTASDFIFLSLDDGRADRKVGTDGADSLRGQGGADRLYGLLGDDSLFGGIGDDSLDGGLGADSMVGGAGEDTFRVHDSDDVVIERSSSRAESDTVIASVDFTLPAHSGGEGSVEALLLATSSARDAPNWVGVGNGLDNLLFGNSGANLLFGEKGDDTLIGYLGDDKAYGGADEDVLDLGAGDDRADGGSGTDSVFGGAGDDELLGGEEADHLYGGSGNDRLNGGNSPDRLNGGTGEDYLRGGAGDDFLEGGDGADRMLGGKGADTFALDGDSGGPPSEVLDFVGAAEGAGDKLLIRIGAPLDGWIGTAAFDAAGTAQVRFQQLGEGGGILEVDALGDGAVDVSVALPGIASAEQLTAADFIFRSLRPGDDTEYGTSDADLLRGLDGDDSLFGGSGGDRLYGGSGDDLLVGGDDRLTGAGGALDSLSGGTGSDTFWFGVHEQGLAARLLDFSGTADGGTDKIRLEVGSWYGDATGIWVGDAAFSGDGVPEVRFSAVDDAKGKLEIDRDGGGVADFTVELVGVSAVDQITGTDFIFTELGPETDVFYKDNTGDDRFFGFGGDDGALAGGGSDRLYGGIGDDYLDGGRDDDTMAGGPGLDTLIGRIGDDLQKGGDGDDLLTGGFGDDTLFGGEGKDVLEDDSLGALFGGSGDDTFLVISGVEIGEAEDGGSDTVFASRGPREPYYSDFALPTNEDGKTFVENLVLVNGPLIEYCGYDPDYCDTILRPGPYYGRGNTLDNIIWGSSDYNVLWGGDGFDSMFGRGGRDTFAFDRNYGLLEQGVVMDFTTGVDKIRLGVFDGTGEWIGPSPFDASGTPQARLREPVDDYGYVEVDVDGNGSNDLVIAIKGVSQVDELTGTDFIFDEIRKDGDDVEFGGDESDDLRGVGGDDRLYGRSGNDYLNGGCGQDILQGGSAADEMVGASGDDTFHVDDSGDRVVEAGFRQGDDTVFAAVDFALPALADEGFVEQLRLLARGGDIAGVGNDLDNLLRGNAGDNALFGARGEDTVLGALGDDSLFGGSGRDTLKGADGQDRLYGGKGADQVNGGSGIDFLYGGAGGDSFLFNADLVGSQGVIGDFSGAAFGGADKIRIDVEGSSAEWIAQGDFEGAGRAQARFEPLGEIAAIEVDRDGDGQQDFEVTLLGISDVDQVTGQDFLFSRPSGIAEETLTANHAAQTWSGSSLNELYYAGGGNDSLRGKAGDDTLFGGSANDRLEGMSGYDLLYGGNQDDRLSGGPGRDALFGDDGADKLYGGRGSDNLVGGLVPDDLFGGKGDDVVFGGSGRDTLYGGERNDTLLGESRQDDLHGGSGRDVLYGGQGGSAREADRLFGGSGGDTFGFDGRVYGGVLGTVWDFDPDEGDKILIIVPGNDAEIIGTASFTEGILGAEVRVTDAGGSSLLVHVNMDGNRWEDFRFSVLKSDSFTELTATDFIFS